MEIVLTFGIVGLLMAAVTALHLHVTTRRAEPTPVPAVDDVDAEFFRIIEQVGLRPPG